MIVLGLAAAWWSLHGDRLLRITIMDASRDALGTQVDIRSLRIDYRAPSITIRGLQIADPFDHGRNLLEADALLVELEPRPLLERKLVIRRLAVRGARTGSLREAPARAVPGGGFAPAALTAARGWAAQFQVPLLSLTPIDTIRSLVLDPSQLATVRHVLALRQRADSISGAVEHGWRGLRLEQTLDSSRALVRRLSSVSPLTLGLDGTRRAVLDARQGIRSLEAARARVEALESAIREGTLTLNAGARAIDDNVRADYAFARGLLELPTFDAPEIGSALFGQVSIEQFERALYWTEVAERFVPPGLRPTASAGPKRARAAGATVRYPRAEAYPRFHLRQGDLELTVGSGESAARYGARLTNATGEPALVGEPMRLVLRRLSGPPSGARVSADGTLDRTGATPRDNASITTTGFVFAPWMLPGLPLEVEPRAATMQLRFSRDGDRMFARWHVVSDSVIWLPDSARAAGLNVLETMVVRVVSGIRRLEVTAELEGELRRPSLRVRSNLDRAIAASVRRVVGEEVARAEVRARAAVDRIVERETAPLRAQLATVQHDGERRVAEAKELIEAERAALEARLRGLGGSLLGS